jgi:cytochrome c2
MKLTAFFRVVLTCAVFGCNASIAATVNIENGKAIDQNKCYACHAKKTGFGNGDMIYTRSDSKVNSLAKLKTMVERCNTELRLDLFPEDEADVVAYLNKQFYKFKQ